jgi:hypothetical protein
MRTVLHVGNSLEDAERIRRDYVNIYDYLNIDYNSWHNRIEIPSENKCIKFISMDSLDRIRGYTPTDIIIDDYVNMNTYAISILHKHNLIDINEDGSLK